ncbi:MAG: aspartate aminotransferase family protein [Myxococcales bacterium]
MRIPETGVDKDTLLTSLGELRGADLDWRSGRTFGYIYDAGREVEAVGKAAYAAFLTENALDPTAFPSLLRLEREVVRMAATHLRGGDEVVGNFTSGGTESIMLAVKTAREWARAARPGVTAPEIVVPETAHAAFHKAAHYLGVRVVPTPVDPVTFRADPDAVRAAITQSTIQLVGSAASYAHGVVDPIEELGAVALEHGLLFHVDGCIGGFLLPYLRRLGAPVPRFELDVPGVTSISMDLHKYAYAPKGASIVLHRDKALRRHQIYSCARWSGYGVVNPTVQSTKSGGPLAAAWAVLHHVGDDGYLALARRLRDATAQILEGVRSIPGLRVLGEPLMSLVAFTSDTASVFHVADEMKERGFYIQAQHRFGCSPANLHLTIGPENDRHVPAMLDALRESVAAAAKLPSGHIGKMVAGALPSLDLNGDGLQKLMGMLGVGAELPKRMAPINEVLDALPPEAREAMLAAFVNEMFV